MSTYWRAEARGGNAEGGGAAARGEERGGRGPRCGRGGRHGARGRRRAWLGFWERENGVGRVAGCSRSCGRKRTAAAMPL
jgi:hypothetical protein